MTIHKADCKKMFFNYDMSCPRCQELARGETPLSDLKKESIRKAFPELLELCKPIKDLQLDDRLKLQFLQLYLIHSQDIMEKAVEWSLESLSRKET